MGNDVSHFFEKDWESAKDVIGGMGDGLKDTLTGFTTGNFNYSDASRDWKNYGRDVKDAFTGGNSHQNAPQTTEQIQRENYNRAVNPNSAWNKQNWQTYTANRTNAVYGSGVGNDNVKPTDLMKISNPNVKMMYAASRGGNRSALMLVGSGVDRNMASVLAPQPAMASDNTNSAGGEGHATSADVGEDQFKDPNVAPTGTSQPVNDAPVSTEDAQGGHFQPNASSRL